MEHIQLCVSSPASHTTAQRRAAAAVIWAHFYFNSVHSVVQMHGSMKFWPITIKFDIYVPAVGQSSMILYDQSIFKCIHSGVIEKLCCGWRAETKRKRFSNLSTLAWMWHKSEKHKVCMFTFIYCEMMWCDTSKWNVPVCLARREGITFLTKILERKCCRLSSAARRPNPKVIHN